MRNNCILCKEPIDKINDEHIIPEAILGAPLKTENILISNHICLKCNNTTGKDVDSEFLNLDEVKALRLLHKDFLNKNTNPKLLLKNIIYIKFDDQKIPCDLYIDKNGQKIIPSKKPIKNGNTLIFIKHEKKVDKFIKKIENDKNYNDVKKSEYKFAIEGNLDLSKIINNKFKTSNFTAPFSRLFFKMIIEYISYKFGQNIALLDKYNPIRELALKKLDKYNTMYKIKFFNLQPYNVNQKKYVDHNIGIKYDKEIKKWIFYFNFYGMIEYDFVIPTDDFYTEVSDLIRIYR